MNKVSGYLNGQEQISAHIFLMICYTKNVIFLKSKIMEKRSFRRITENLDAEVFLDGISHSGIIMNFSENGLYLITATIYSIFDIARETLLELKCQLPSKEILNLNCEVKWFKKKNSPYGVTFSMGMEIIDPPLRYKEFVSTLQ